MRLPRLSLALLALALVAVPAAAQQGGGAAPTAQASQRQALRITVENRTAAAEAARGAPRRDTDARPGDVLRYRLVFQNTAGRPIQGVALANPLAAGMKYVGGSSLASRDDMRVEYSIDGGQTYAAQPMEEVVQEDGTRVRRPAPPEKYTHVRWTVGGWLSPEATVTAEFEARLGTAGQP